MEKILSKAAVDTALQKVGFSQAELARQLSVSPQAVTNWLKGKDFPRPAKLLRLSVLLRIPFEQLVDQSQAVGAPIIAFRKRAGTKTTADHLAHASSMGALLKSVVPFLPPRQTLRPRISAPTVDYAALQQVVGDVRAKLGLGEHAVLEYSHLMGQFHEAGAVLVPVLWGEKQRHDNALHICLPQEDVTFIYLNLDTKLEDFKFWMAHELAHVYTPELAGSEQGEDYADAFAGALLFPKPCAIEAYKSAVKASGSAGILATLAQFAARYSISVYSVFCEVRNYQQHAGLPALQLNETAIHRARNGGLSTPVLVSSAIFNAAPATKTYIAAAERIFGSQIFVALRGMIRSKGIEPGYIQQIMDVSLSDATAIHAELAL